MTETSVWVGKILVIPPCNWQRPQLTLGVPKPPVDAMAPRGLCEQIHNLSWVAEEPCCVPDLDPLVRLVHRRLAGAEPAPRLLSRPLLPGRHQLHRPAADRPRPE